MIQNGYIRYQHSPFAILKYDPLSLLLSYRDTMRETREHTTGYPALPPRRPAALGWIELASFTEVVHRTSRITVMRVC